jgi:hypothetical protein
MIDHQSQMAFATKWIDAVTLRNSAAMVAKAAAGFKVSTILTTVTQKTFSGPIFEEIKDAFPGADVIDRTSMNTWEDGRVTERVNKIGKNRLVFAGLVELRQLPPAADMAPSHAYACVCAKRRPEQVQHTSNLHRQHVVALYSIAKSTYRMPSAKRLLEGAFGGEQKTCMAGFAPRCLERNV